MKELETFGNFIKAKRLGAQISLRQFAAKLGKAPSYICDIEKDKKHPIEKEFLEEIARILSFSPEDRNKLFDLSTRTRKTTAPTDLAQYMEEMPLASLALRNARDTKLSEEDWKKIIAFIRNSKR